MRGVSMKEELHPQPEYKVKSKETVFVPMRELIFRAGSLFRASFSKETRLSFSVRAIEVLASQALFLDAAHGWLDVFLSKIFSSKKSSSCRAASQSAVFT